MIAGPETRGPRPLLALALLFAVPVVAGAIVAPQIYRLLVWLGGHLDLGPRIADPEFKRVLSRCVLAVAVIALWPAIRLSGVRSLGQIGWKPMPGRWSSTSAWFAVGALSVLGLYLYFDWAGALYLRPRSPEIGRMLSKFTGALIGAVFIGVFEELFFRGYVYGLMRRALRWLPAAFLASAVFAVIHLARPAAPEGLDPTRWYAGFQLLPHIADGVEARYLAPSMTNLFLMGVLLCLIYERTGVIYPAIGLHAGWVWALAVGTYLFDRKGASYWYLFGESETLSMMWLGAVVLLAFLIVVPFTLPRNAEPESVPVSR